MNRLPTQWPRKSSHDHFAMKVACFMLRSLPLVPGEMLLSAVMIVGLAGRLAQQTAPPVDAAQMPSHDDHDHADDKRIAAALAKLSPANRALAEKQEICPVSGDPLGSMGTPVKLTLEGRELFICCAGCEDAVREDPEKYFKKLDEHVH